MHAFDVKQIRGGAAISAVKTVLQSAASASLSDVPSNPTRVPALSSSTTLS